jgi:Uma2 family endonuclease
MTALKKPKLTVNDYLTWAAAQPDEHRYELVKGEIVAQAAQRIGHLRAKFACVKALEAAIIAARLGCHALPDGATVRINENNAFEPDALVYCGPELDDDEIEAPNPVIVVEVLSPSTATRDLRDKLIGYFQVPSIRHYLIVDLDERLVIHHARGDDGVWTTRLVRDGALRLDPPGLDVAMSDLFA